MSRKKSNPSATIAATLPRGIAGALRAVSHRHLQVRVGQFPFLMVTALSALWLVQALVDRYFRLPLGVRAILMAVDVAVVLFLLWKWVVLPVRRRLDRRGAALLVERALPEFDSSLISAVEFCEPHTSHPSGEMLRALLHQVSQRISGADIAARTVSDRELRLRMRWAGIAFAVMLGAALLTGWKMSLLLGQRIFLSGTPLPGDTEVVALSGDFMVEAGADALLGAQARGVIPANGWVIITTHDGEVSTIPVAPARAGGPGIFRYTVKNVREAFSYRFKINDGVGSRHRVTVNVPPVLRQIRFAQAYPEYTKLPETAMSPGSLRLLEGSKFRISGIASEGLAEVSLTIKGSGEESQVVPMTLGKDSSSFSAELPVPASGWKSMTVKLKTPDGRVSTNEPAYRIDLVTDRPPAVSLVLPKKDRVTVVPGTRVVFSYKAADDFGLRDLRLRYRIFRPGLSGTLNPGEEHSLPVSFDRELKSGSGEVAFDLATMVPTIPVGCSVNCWMEAVDSNPKPGGVRTLSKEKVIAVVNEEEKRMELLEQMEQRAQEIEQLYNQQRLLNQPPGNPR